MDKKTLGVVGAIGSLAAMPLGVGAAQAEPAVPPAQSYADLLQPISNPVERLQLADQQEQEGLLIPAQYRGDDPNYDRGGDRNYDRRDDRNYDRRDDRGDYRSYDRHHHHHFYHSRRWYMSRGYVWYNGAWVYRRAHHHHHHHHSHY